MSEHDPPMEPPSGPNLPPSGPNLPPSGAALIPTPTIQTIPVTSAVVGTVYTIESLGDTTQVQWAAMGSTATPTTGSTFTATAVGVGTGTISYSVPAVNYKLLEEAYLKSLEAAESEEFDPQAYLDGFDYNDEDPNPIEDNDIFEYNEEELTQENLFLNPNNFSEINYNTFKTELGSYRSGANELIRIFTTTPNFLNIANNPGLANLISDFIPKFIKLAQDSKIIIKDISDDYKKKQFKKGMKILLLILDLNLLVVILFLLYF